MFTLSGRQSHATLFLFIARVSAKCTTPFFREGAHLIILGCGKYTHTQTRRHGRVRVRTYFIRLALRSCASNQNGRTLDALHSNGSAWLACTKGRPRRQPRRALRQRQRQQRQRQPPTSPQQCIFVGARFIFYTRTIREAHAPE